MEWSPEWRHLFFSRLATGTIYPRGVVFVNSAAERTDARGHLDRGALMRLPVIGVMGAAAPSPEALVAAENLGKLIAERGWVLLTGGRSAGVMAAACAGAKQVPGSLTVGILPGAVGGEAADLDIAVFTGMGEARNVINVLTSDVVVACGVESAGTISEIALAIKAEKPVILLHPSAAAWSLFAGLPAGARLFQAAAPEEVVKVLEEQLGIRPAS
jgi:uncharacterized protein (TIGR00725 family)